MFSFQKSERENDFISAQQRLVELAIGKEGKNTKQNDLCENFVSSDGKKYGIVKEMQYLYIKEGDKGAKHSDEFDYIGGVMNKNKYRFNNMAAAEKRLFELKEKYGTLLTEQEEPQQNQQRPQPQPEAKPQVDMDIEPPPATEEPPAPETDADPEAGMEPMKEINSLMGKLGYELRQTEVSPNTAVSLLKQLIAALPMGELSQEEKDEVSLSIKHGKSDVKGYETAGPQDDTPTPSPIDGGDDSGLDVDFGDDSEIDEMLEQIEKELHEMEIEQDLDEAFEQSKKLLSNKSVSTSMYFE